MTSLALAPAPGGVRIQVRVIPRSPRTTVDGVREGRLLLRVTAPPVDDNANHAVVKLLARTLGLPPSAVRIVAGAAARNKTLEIAGLDAAGVRSRLGFGT